jgi:hypothetical protein
MEGDHEEVIFTSLGKYQMYEVQRPAAAGNPLNAESKPEQHLRYAVQKVSDKWLIHHMAGPLPGPGCSYPTRRLCGV